MTNNLMDMMTNNLITLKSPGGFDTSSSLHAEGNLGQNPYHPALLGN